MMFLLTAHTETTHSWTAPPPKAHRTELATAGYGGDALPVVRLGAGPGPPEASLASLARVLAAAGWLRQSIGAGALAAVRRQRDFPAAAKRLADALRCARFSERCAEDLRRREDRREEARHACHDRPLEEAAEKVAARDLAAACSLLEQAGWVEEDEEPGPESSAGVCSSRRRSVAEGGSAADADSPAAWQSTGEAGGEPPAVDARLERALASIPRIKTHVAAALQASERREQRLQVGEDEGPGLGQDADSGNEPAGARDSAVKRLFGDLCAGQPAELRAILHADGTQCLTLLYR